MLFTSVAALLFPVAIMAAPASKPAPGDDQCTPVAYTVSEYNRTTNPDYAFVSFNVQSSYIIDSRASDPVKAGVNCEADGAIISSNQFQCNTRGERLDELVCMLRGRQDEDRYRIHHRWQCNNATWESINNFDLLSVPCDHVEDGKNGDTVKCSFKSFVFTPQNVRKLENDKKATKAAKPTAKPSVCSNPPKCDV
ncbi:hypothetical protein E8E12_001609 [Didymella heteroderae]|uniref:Uncharacterized protein n=1 Tax=Didymella heteroderae TaxID=1769908 RepID=A0A9P5C2T9_9PLEO|nr:hypothetical protein E8E12_001609 [Didymella heteroderae]